ncbi:protein of unknown function [Taphrina deformans PYCC 5710]|uniref:Major facilitator superfamily (MFS) profile domain-containing protein n=1 Tax=Taphrina deformans (strain PYCC 5710 / ATCC 11124 / CBS 356.35 / IMI 108563 / JCM 9778 / NBRC 8474) TaxID=1097556 RepID=R4XEH2_TAPDE|nr:protein of unknown function [Taphrina deformans PYCC 5710]|eukprot:CCG84161.1 protein of unknown function [Taphrina deformans PYCC 5710]
MDEDVPGTCRLYDVEASSTTSDAPLLVPQPTDSPHDPLNWSLTRKVWHTILVCSVTGLTAAISNDAGSAQDQMNEQLGISYDVMNDAAGILFLGIAMATFLLYPSTILYGRRIQYMISLVFGFLGSIWFARTQTAGDSIGSQLFCGISESCAEALVQLSLCDIYFSHQRGSAIAMYVLATSVGTFMGPLLAGLIETGQGTFRWIGWWGAISSGLLLVVFFFGLQESYYDRTLAERETRKNLGDDAIGDRHFKAGDDRHILGEEAMAKSDEKGAPAQELIAPRPRANDPATTSSSRSRAYLKSIALITPSRQVRGTGLAQYGRLLWTFPRIFLLPAVVYSGIQWGAQDAWLTFYLTTEAETWYDAPYNYTDKAAGLMNVPSLIGAIIGCLYAGPLSDWFCLWCARRRGGLRESEDRLVFFVLPGLVSPAGMLLFGIGSDRGWHWPVPYLGLGFIGFGWGCAGDLALSYLIDSYPELVLEGLVAVALINNLIAMVGAFVTQSWLDSAGVAGTYISLAVLDFVIIIVLTAIIMVYGKRWRRASVARYSVCLQMKETMNLGNFGG